METEQSNITKAVLKIAAEASRVAVQPMAMASTDINPRIQNVVSKLGGPIMKQLTFHWSSINKCAELRNLKMEVKNMFLKLYCELSRKNAHYKKTG